MNPTFTAAVQKKVKSKIPVLDGKGKPVFLDPLGKPIPRDDAGNLPPITGALQKFEEIESDSIDDPLTDEAGNVVAAGTEEALLRKVKEHYAEEEDTTVLAVEVRKTEVVRQVSGADLAAVK